MTLVPEVFLARELELCYAAICYVVNYAEGVQERSYQPGVLFEGLATPQEIQRVKAVEAGFGRNRSEAAAGAGQDAQGMPLPLADGTVPPEGRYWSGLAGLVRIKDSFEFRVSRVHDYGQETLYKFIF